MANLRSILQCNFQTLKSFKQFHF